MKCRFDMGRDCGEGGKRSDGGGEMKDALPWRDNECCAVSARVIES